MDEPPTLTKRRIKRIAPLQLGKMPAILYGVMGILFIPVFLLMTVFASQMPGQQRVGFMALKRAMKLILVHSAAIAAIAAVAAEPSKPPVFQVRLVVDAASVDSEQMTFIGRSGEDRDTHRETLNVQRAVLMEATSVKSATVVTNAGTGNPEIEIALTEEGQRRFAEVTGQNIGKRLAIIIDGQIYSAPAIRSVISGGTCLISGRFTPKEAAEFAAKINRSARK